jgi:hypothetical protein
MGSSDDKQQDLWTWAKRQAIGKMDLSFGARECWRIIEGFPKGRCYPTHYWIACSGGRTTATPYSHLSRGPCSLLAMLHGRHWQGGCSDLNNRSSNEYLHRDLLTTSSNGLRPKFPALFSKKHPNNLSNQTLVEHVGVFIKTQSHRFRGLL